jgi:hypothetical protein
MSDQPETVSADEITPTHMPTPIAPASAAQPQPAAAPSEPAPVTPEADANVARDSAGVPFDAARHLSKKNPHTGRWMPRGGRKPKVAASGVPNGTSPGVPASDASSAPRVESFIPTEPPPPKPEGNAASADKAAPEPEIEHSDDAAEVVCSALQVVAGIAFESPEDCTPAPAEHKNMVRATAAYIRAKGWQATAGIGLALMFGAFLLKVLRKPKPQAKVREWFGLDGAKDVTPPEALAGGVSRQADAPPAQSKRPAEIIELPAHVPPLAR